MAKRNPLEGLTQENAKKAYLQTLNSVDIHIRSAQLIAADGIYGGAVTHLVLSTEEMVKGLLFYLESLGTDINKIPSINLFFSDHVVRHYFTVLFSMLNRIIKPLVALILKSKEEIHNSGIEIEYTEEEKVILSKDPKRIMGNFYDIKTMLDWWDEANNKKNGGLYVDVVGKDIFSPADVNEAEYIRAKKIAQQFRADVVSLIDEIDNGSAKEKKEFVKAFKKNEMANLISKVIQARQHEKKGGTSYDFLLDK
jgi:AbiV family abortive infection protein